MSHKDSSLIEEIKIDSLFNFTYDPLKEALSLIASQIAYNNKSVKEMQAKIAEFESIQLHRST